MVYRWVKKIVLVVLLGGLLFMFAYLFMGDTLGLKLASLFGSSSASDSPQSSGGPPAPVMQRVQELKNEIAANPKDGAACFQLAELYFQANMFDKALLYYKQSVEADENDLAARNNLAICYHLVGKDKEALRELDKALKTNPDSQHLWLTLGIVSYESGDLQMARQALEKANQLDPTSDLGTKAKSMLGKLSQSRK